MANPSYRTYTTTGEKDPWNADWLIAPFTTTIGAIIVSGAAEYAIEFTLDDLTDTAVTPRWIAFADAPAGTTVSKVIHANFPVRFVRINIAVITGSVEFKIIPAMSIN